MPDLIITNVVLDPPSPLPNEPFDVIITVKNQGGAGTGGLVETHVYVSDAGAPVPDLEDYIFAENVSIDNQDILAGEDRVDRITIDPLDVTSYRVYAYADANELVTESNETNNAYGPVGIVNVSIGGVNQDEYFLQPGSSTRQSYGMDNGPVRISSTVDGTANNVKIIAAMRAVWIMDGKYSSYSELMGLPKEQLSSEYWFPWYNNLATPALDEQFRFGNADTVETNVYVSVGGTIYGPYNLQPGASMRQSFAEDRGPVRIWSAENKKIIAAMRAVWIKDGKYSSYSELMGLPKEQLSSEYVFPWYNNLATTALDEQFRFGNVDTTDVTIDIYVGNTLLDSYLLAPGVSMRQSFAVNNGPIRIRSRDGVKKIIAAMRAVWITDGRYTSYSELMGLPKEQLSSEYWFPWYNNLATTALDEQFRFGVP
jgi:hypothetical protein